MIVAAAIKLGDVIYTAPNGGGVCKHPKDFTKTRHCCVYNNNHEIHQRVVKEKIRDTQGFITDLGEFLDRNQAGDYAFKHGQIKEPNDFLFSEDLW
ncbi:MAG: hypothetical protein M0R17_05160 [Candidatus Omnitrophica bacterium]|jgi:hypothetical protein|nr:hypothetical protein [Candidatus Omnitrophota bacterium]